AVERAGEVLEAAVDLQGHDPVPTPEAAGQLQGGDDVGSGRGAAEDPVGPGRLARHRERIRGRYRDHLVEVLRLQQRWPAADAATLDAMGARLAPAEHGRLRGLDRHALQGWQ